MRPQMKLTPLQPRCVQKDNADLLHVEVGYSSGINKCVDAARRTRSSETMATTSFKLKRGKKACTVGCCTKKVQIKRSLVIAPAYEC